MVNEFCGFKHGVIGTDKMPSDTTLNNMKKADLIKLLHTAQHNYETLMWFYNNAVNANMAQLNNNGWIPCSVQLPKKSGKYIITQERYNVDDRFHTGRKIIEVDYVQFDATDNTWSRAKFFNVIAWMPLPAPYQQKEGK